MSEQYPKSEGGMWKNSAKASEKHPDWRGHVEISSPQLRMLLAMAKDNQANPDPEFKLKLQIAAKTSPCSSRSSQQSSAGCPQSII